MVLTEQKAARPGPVKATAPHFDVIGVGFGPSNLALAIALDDAIRLNNTDRTYHFVEKQKRFTWHGGMLLPDSDMQISFMKDLVSLRDPTNPFTFINYLHVKGRLEAFINQKTFFPSRIEFNDYLSWVAGCFDEHCSYGEEVVSIAPEPTRTGISSLLVISRSASGNEVLRRTDNLAIAVGGAPHIPTTFQPIAGEARVFHSAHYLERIGNLNLENSAGGRVAVIGGGQSAAEIVLDLLDRFPLLEVEMIFRGYALKPSDDTPFVNEIFDPDFISFIFSQPEARRRDFLKEFRNTNYAVVDGDLIQKLYAILYQQRIRGPKRLSLRCSSEILQATAETGGIALSIGNRIAGISDTGRYDAVVLATGYQRDTCRNLLASVEPYIEDFSVDRRYRLRTRSDFRPQIYIQGHSETSHGLSDTLLSVLSIRSQEIAESMLSARKLQSVQA